MAKVLTDEALVDRILWRANYDGCTCFLSAPCNGCTHPGNPHNQAEDPRAWKTVCDKEADQ